MRRIFIEHPDYPDKRSIFDKLDRPEGSMKNTYSHNFTCLNCGFKDEVKIAKGTSVRNFTCPNCGLRPKDIE